MAQNTEEFLTEFIACYKSNPCLWQLNNLSYHNNERKSVAYNQMLIVAKRFYREANIKFVKQKIKYLRDTYRREKAKVKALEASGIPYQTTLWCYDSLSFIMETGIDRSGSHRKHWSCYPPEKQEANANQEGDPVFVDINNYAEDIITDVDIKPTLETKNAQNKGLDSMVMVRTPADEFQIFADFVASEMRLLKSRSNVTALKRKIQRAILDAAEVDSECESD